MRNIVGEKYLFHHKNKLKRCFVIIGILFMMFCLISCTPIANNNSLDDKQRSENTTVSKTSNILTSKGELKVHFIDVGQADSILIEQENISMLIDAGNNSDSSAVKNYLKSQGIYKLDYVIASHPHEDHIGALDNIIKSFEIDKIYMSKISITTRAYYDVMNAIKEKGMSISKLKVGENFKLTFGKTSFLLTGDAEKLSENEILAKGLDISADVLKVGHHGSSSSTTELFLSQVNPKYAIIMVGKDNIFQFPSESVLQRLEAKEIKIYRTDNNGNIVVLSDGENITFQISNITCNPLKIPYVQHFYSLFLSYFRSFLKFYFFSNWNYKDINIFRISLCHYDGID